MSKFPLFGVLFLLLAAVYGCAAPAQPSPTAPPPSPTLTSPPTEPPPTPTPDPAAPIAFAGPDFVFQGEDPSIPIVTHDPSPAIENLYINPGAVLYHDGLFHMFFNSFTAWPGVVEVGYMTSPDGYQWQMAQDEPVFVTDQIPYGRNADVSSVLVLDDGTWVLYFHTVGGGEIGRATADSPLGPWSVDPEPVLRPDPEGWDSLELGWPSVVRTGDEFRMYYGAKTQRGFAIGLATSPDGVVWTRYDDPATTGEGFAASDPVLTAEADWELNKVDRPRVAPSPHGWAMIYQGGAKVEERGLALSRDGIHWQKYPANPIFTSEAFPIPAAKTWDTTLVYQDGAYYYFMELGTLSGTNLYLTTHQGALLEE